MQSNAQQQELHSPPTPFRQELYRVIPQPEFKVVARPEGRAEPESSTDVVQEAPRSSSSSTSPETSPSNKKRGYRSRQRKLQRQKAAQRRSVSGSPSPTRKRQDLRGSPQRQKQAPVEATNKGEAPRDDDHPGASQDPPHAEQTVPSGNTQSADVTGPDPRGHLPTKQKSKMKARPKEI